MYLHCSTYSVKMLCMDTHSQFSNTVNNYITVVSSWSRLLKRIVAQSMAAYAVGSVAAWGHGVHISKHILYFYSVV